MTAILNEDPPGISQVTTNIPPALQRVVHRCLEKSPEQRFQSASDLAFALDALSESGASAYSPMAAKAATGAGKRWKVIAPATLAVLALSVGSYLYFHRTPKLTDKDTIVLADFDNTTGDPVFDGALRQGLSVQLEQSPFLSFVSEQQIQQTLQMMGQKPDAKLTPEIARELCQRTGSTAVLEGSIAQIGTQYLLTLKAVNCVSGESLASTEAQASDKSHILDALGRVASETRNKLGESLTTVQKFDTPIKQATTPSLEALQFFSLGWKAAVGEDDSASAVPLFQRAISLDPNFAMAYASLGAVYWNLGENRQASDNLRKAFELREHVSEREKMFIAEDYYGIVTGDLEKAQRVSEVWAQTYPRDSEPPTELGIYEEELGQHEKSLAEHREALRLDPNSGLKYRNAIFAYCRLNRFAEARATAEEAEAKKIDVSRGLYMLGFLQNDAAEMKQQVALNAGKPGVEDWFLEREASTAAYFGRLKDAREFSRRAVASADSVDEHEAAANYEVDAALRESLLGNAAEARHRIDSALKLSIGRDEQYGVALANAITGSPARAQALAEDLGKNFPEDTVVRFSYLPTVYAEVALSQNDTSRAIEVLRASVPYELGVDASLYPVYVRGEAFLAAHRGSEAAAEFQKILDHRGIVADEPIGALAHLQIGRAYAMQGDTSKAKAAYQDFLTLWKDADPDIPILKQAKAEYAKLQ